jgi:hypothetical protein
VVLREGPGSGCGWVWVRGLRLMEVNDLINKGILDF